MKKELFNKIFGKQMQFSRLLLASIGFVLGLSIVLTTSDLYIKVSKILDPNTSGSTYLMINKKVGFSNLFGSSGLSEKQINSLKEHPSVQSVSGVSSNQFKTWLEIDIAGQGLVTDFFFESFPDEFIDDKPVSFKWREGDDIIPVIVPKDFLNLYNFGYAISQGLPQVSPEMAKLIVGKVTVGRRINNAVFKIKIVALSDRIPTVIVPDSFMKYANSHFSEKKGELEKGRLVVKVDGSRSQGLDALITKLGLETKKDPLNKDQIKVILKGVTGLLLIIGIAFMILSVINIILIYSLIVSESKNEMRILIQLGYTPKMVYNFFAEKFYVMFFIQVLISLILYSIIAYITYLFTDNLGHRLNFFEWPSLVIGLVLVIINLGIFRRDLTSALLKYSYA
jgi:hypothetical protein